MKVHGIEPGTIKQSFGVRCGYAYDLRLRITTQEGEEKTIDCRVDLNHELDIEKINQADHNGILKLQQVEYKKRTSPNSNESWDYKGVLLKSPVIAVFPNKYNGNISDYVKREFDAKFAQTKQDWQTQ